MQTSLFRIETRDSSPITIRDAQIYVRSQVVQLRFPAVDGGLIWNRPVAIVVRAFDGQETIVPIVDLTRMVVLTLAGLSFAAMFVLRLLRRKTSES